MNITKGKPYKYVSVEKIKEGFLAKNELHISFIVLKPTEEEAVGAAEEWENEAIGVLESL